MTKPTPEQFGLTTETVNSLTEEKARRDKLRATLCIGSCIGLCVIAFITLYIRNLPTVWLNSIGHLFGSLFFIGWLVVIGSGAGMLIGSLLLSILNTVLPDPLRYKTLTRYLKQVALYDAWFIRTQDAFWERLTGRGFEIEVTDLLNRAGYCAHLTPASGDEGVDIVLGDGTIVQCKAHRAPASPGVVRELYGALIHRNAPKAMLISLSGVTRGVHSFIKDKPITVWDRTNLIALQKVLDKP